MSSSWAGGQRQGKAASLGQGGKAGRGGSVRRVAGAERRPLPDREPRPEADVLGQAMGHKGPRAGLHESRAGVMFPTRGPSSI